MRPLHDVDSVEYALAEMNEAADELDAVLDDGDMPPQGLHQGGVRTDGEPW
jgi:hypothetical protein